MSKWIHVAAATVMLSILFLSPSGNAQALGPCGPELRVECPTATATGDGVDVGASKTREETTGSTAATDERPGRKPGSSIFVEVLTVPTCDGNQPGSAINLCEAATTVCPEPDAVQVWTFRRTVDSRVRGPRDPFVRDPGVRCLPSYDPALAADPLAALPGLVEREFQRVVVLKAVPVVNPAPKTLIRIPTRLSTSTVEAYDIPVSILGQSVVITATAKAWAWDFGDGQRATVTGSGRAGRTEHEYRSTGARSARVDITWTGVYRLNGGPPLPIAGTVTTQGVPTQIQVVQARSELIAQ